MTTPFLIRKSLRQHAASTLVTAVAIALGAGLFMTVWIAHREARRAFTAHDGGFDAVLGARGSKLQLVLNTLFHLEASPGNISMEDWQTIQRHPAVKAAIPIALGDNYRGFRIVGTTLEMFEHAVSARGTKLKLRPGGYWFDAARREAVVGSFAASQLGLRPGDTFHPFHGLNFDEQHQHGETYVVVGVLEPSNTPADRVLWIPVRGIQKMEGHDPGLENDLSGVLVKLSNPTAGFQLDLQYNRQGNQLTWAWPVSRIMAEFFTRVTWVDRLLTLLAASVAIVATAGVFVGVYSSMDQRRRDIAILRALGAPRRIILQSVVGEAAVMAGIGVAGAWAASLVLLTVIGAVLQAQTGIVLDPWAHPAVWLWSAVLQILLGALAGWFPAWIAYRTDVIEHLQPVS